MTCSRPSVSSRPVPIPDEQSAPFWEATARHVLTMPRCSRCGRLAHPPDDICPHCHSSSPDFVLTEVSGDGVIRSWTVIRQSFLPGFDVPFVLVDVELDAQQELRLIGRLIGGENDSLRLGARARLAFEDLTPNLAVPAFALEPA